MNCALALSILASAAQPPNRFQYNEQEEIVN